MNLYKSYPEYLESPHWKTTRTRILEGDGYRCVVCTNNPADHVHHINYRNWVDVKDTDLASVCEGCHCKIHLAIDAGFISMNNRSSLTKTLSGLKDLQEGKALSKTQKRDRTRYILDEKFCSRLDSASYHAKQLFCGALKRSAPKTYLALVGLCVSKTVFDKLSSILGRDPYTTKSRSRGPYQIFKNSRKSYNRRSSI